MQYTSGSARVEQVILILVASDYGLSNPSVCVDFFFQGK